MELERKYYSVEGWEDSFIQLMMDNFVMNSTDIVNDSPVTMYSYVHDHVNSKTKESVTRVVKSHQVNPNVHDAKWDASASFGAYYVCEKELKHARHVAP